jgi:hypothetical protein
VGAAPEDGSEHATAAASTGGRIERLKTTGSVG